MWKGLWGRNLNTREEHRKTRVKEEKIRKKRVREQKSRRMLDGRGHREAMGEADKE